MLLSVMDIIPWKQYINNLPIEKEILQNDFLHLLKSDSEKDYSLVFRETEFKLHQYIIEVRCPALLTIERSKLEIVSVQCLENLIKYIYTDKCDLEISQTLFELKWLAKELNFKSLLDTINHTIIHNLRLNMNETICLCEKFKCDDILQWIQWFTSIMKDSPFEPFEIKLSMSTDSLKDSSDKVGEKNLKNSLDLYTSKQISTFSTFSTDMERLLEKNEGGLRLMINDTPLNLHKAILKSRCLFFRSMFNDCWTSSNKPEVEHDTLLSTNSFKEMIRYFYTGKLDSFSEKMVSEEILEHGGFYCIDNDFVINYCKKILIDPGPKELVKSTD